MELERKLSLNPSSIHTEKYLRPVHGQVGQTQCHVHSLGRSYDGTHLHDSLDGRMKSVKGKLYNTKVQPDVCDPIKTQAHFHNKFELILRVKHIQWDQEQIWILNKLSSW